MIKAGLVLTLLLATEALATELYRYHDSAGTVVTADTIPPLAAATGCRRWLSNRQSPGSGAMGDQSTGSNRYRG
jgi:hypothetical protein